MSENPKLAYGFILNVDRGNGDPSIFIHRFFPDQVVALEPSPSTGANVTVQCADRSELTVSVTQSVTEIEKLIARCRELENTLESD